jgi:phosphoglucomutase
MDSQARYSEWLTNSYFDSQTKKELEAIKDNPAEIEDRFYKELEFGTAGMRGIIGAGTNRMNIYTVRKATQGLAMHICSQGEDMKRKGAVPDGPSPREDAGNSTGRH